MPRGRHRHSPPLHRLLPPSAVAGAAVACAAGAWLFTEPMLLRGLSAGAAAAAVVGAVVMRRWDRVAGKRVADLGRSLKGAEWRHEERVAELESDLEESRELRARMEGKLRAKRAELAALRNEHAALLRRYATAETERASALEGRRLLAIEAAVPTRALPPPDPAPGTATAAPEGGTGSVATPGLYAQAGAALNRLAARAAAGGTPEGDVASKGDLAAKGDAAVKSDAAVNGDAAVKRAAAPEGDASTPGGEDPAAGKSPAADGHERAAATKRSGYFTVPTASAVVPPAPVRRPSVQGGFDFFGTKRAAALEAVQNEDLADVVGEEVLALHKAESESEFKPPAGRVIDLTEHDETEQINVADLRTALQA
ncbi:hypothetical protein ACWCP6_17580 [Streptomyces sp. NPDC002004]